LSVGIEKRRETLQYISSLATKNIKAGGLS
jgi:hypothetical protein